MKCYRVGGAVRDALLQYPCHENDWVVVGATPDDMLKAGYRQVGKDFPVFLHPQTQEEYALARTERKNGTGYHGFEINASPDVTLEEDLLRRDLTINAIAEDSDGSLIDPYGGQADLQAGILRHVSPAFAEDPLRVLRVARFAARYHHLGFTVAPETLALMSDLSHSGELQTLARERIWQEFSRGLAERSPHILLQVLLECGAIQALFPQWLDALNPGILNALATAHTLDTSERFALCCQPLQKAPCMALCQAIAAPKQASQLALLTAQLIPLPEAQTLTAETLLTLLETCDVLRRPEQLQQLLRINDCLTGQAQSLYRQAAQRITDVSSRELIALGYQGPALGQALRDKRLQLLAQML